MSDRTTSAPVLQPHHSSVSEALMLLRGAVYGTDSLKSIRRAMARLDKALTQRKRDRHELRAVGGARLTRFVRSALRSHRYA